ncbi:MAG: hypothetical protein AAF850_02325 [Pseudomonadota bacterium]
MVSVCLSACATLDNAADAAIGAALASSAPADPFADIMTYSRDDWSRTVTDCDRLAAHPNDPERVSGGLLNPEMDLPRALEACERAVASDPGNPRLNYQLARVYGYSGRHREGDLYRDRALKAGYPQSLFVYGYIRVENWDGRGKDPCYGGELILRSARAGRYAGLVGFPHYALAGEFEACSAYPIVHEAEMRGFLDRAGEEASDYYQTLLVRELTRRLEDKN